MTTSRYEKNIALQPRLIGEILSCPRPVWMDELKGRRVFFVGVGTSHHLAEIATLLWRRHVSSRASAVHSFEFVKVPQAVETGDVVVVLSHRGTKSYTVQSAALAAKAGAVTGGITGKGSPGRAGLTHRLESCELEDTGAFTKSMTSTLAWIVRWIDAPTLKQGLLDACAALESGPAFPPITAEADVILLGDLERQWLAREVSLKLQEAAYLKARPFGLEEFLHGPRLSADAKSLVIAFSTPCEPRWTAVREYLKDIEVPLFEVSAEGEGGWLRQLFWGQRLTAAWCRELGIDPDALRTGDPRYKRAREALSL